MSKNYAVSDMLVTVKSREVQRAIAAAGRGETDVARKHFLAAAHLERVLADDYMSVNAATLSERAMLSAASCFWRAGATQSAVEVFTELKHERPSRVREIEDVEAELAREFPPAAA